MAFTDTEKADIRKYLGWQARFAQFDSALERAFSAIGGGAFPAEEQQARDLVTKIKGIETEIDTAHSRFKADKVGPIALNRNEIRQLVDRGESYIGQLARCMGVPVKGHALRADLPDFGASPWGPMGGGGNAQRQG